MHLACTGEHCADAPLMLGARLEVAEIGASFTHPSFALSTHPELLRASGLLGEEVCEERLGGGTLRALGEGDPELVLLDLGGELARFAFPIRAAVHLQTDAALTVPAGTLTETQARAFDADGERLIAEGLLVWTNDAPEVVALPFGSDGPSVTLHALTPGTARLHVEHEALSAELVVTVTDPDE
jgi:hypothetical protein